MTAPDPLEWVPARLAGCASRWESAAAVVAGESRRTAAHARFEPGRLEGEIRAAAADAIGGTAAAIGRDAAMLAQIAAALREAERRLVAATAAQWGPPGLGGRSGAAVAAALEADAEIADRLLTLLPPDADASDAGMGGAGGADAGGAGGARPDLAGGQLLAARDGMRLVAFGDVAAADRVMLFVPRTGSSPTDPGPQAGRARALIEAAEARDAAPTAVVLYLHDAPQDLVAAAGDDHYPGAAARLRTASLLVADANPAAHLHVMGYSHGALVTAQAATGTGLRADSVSFIGSTALGPGVGTVRDLRLLDRTGTVRDPRGNGARTWSATGEDDPIRAAPHITGRGVPAHARDMGAREVPLPPGTGRWWSGSAHSSYFSGPELGAIADALGEALRRDPPAPRRGP